ncbi:MAG: hypothetical protein K2M34_05110 [Alphaproteobacteria bacterium]|nr:hypothetical protein [Alphaproteobacteria bacterium]
MKQSTNTKASYVYVPATRAQKIWGIVALAGLFACGLMVGLSVRANRHQSGADGNVQLTESQCDIIAGNIQSAVKFSKLDDLEKWKKIYAESCGNHIVTKAQVVSEPKSEQKLSTCEKIEKLLLRDLNSSDSRSYWDHIQNAEVYNKLSQYGCAENADTYKQLSVQETAIANALNDQPQSMSKDMRTCEEIEEALKVHLIYNYDPDNTRARMQNAEVYSTMAERGCPENAEKYKELALRQIDVVSAVSSDNELMQNKDAIVDTYRKLEMQEAARNFLNKMDRLINPATDFIFELERVINE